MKLSLMALCLILFGTLEAKAKMEEREPSFFTHLDWSAEYLSGSKTKFKDPANQGSKLSYSEAEISINYEEPREKQLSVMMDNSYFTANLDWKGNPYFSQTKFSSYKVKMGYAYPFDEYWTWQAGFGADMQLGNFNLKRNTNYNLFLWGRYNYDENTVFNVGILTWLGIKDTQVYPIIGVNYSYNEKWSVNAVFPFKGVVTYMVTEQFGTELAAKWAKLRRRLKSSEAISKGIFEYSSSSLELAGFYNFSAGFTIRGFAGTGFGTSLKVYNSDGKDKQLLKMNNPFFAGITIESEF